MARLRVGMKDECRLYLESRRVNRVTEWKAETGFYRIDRCGVSVGSLDLSGSLLFKFEQRNR